jgi:hypothetical protein
LKLKLYDTYDNGGMGEQSLSSKGGKKQEEVTVTLEEKTAQPKNDRSSTMILAATAHKIRCTQS